MTRSNQDGFPEVTDAQNPYDHSWTASGGTMPKVAELLRETGGARGFQAGRVRTGVPAVMMGRESIDSARLLTPARIVFRRR